MRSAAERRGAEPLISLDAAKHVQLELFLRGNDFRFVLSKSAGDSDAAVPPSHDILVLARDRCADSEERVRAGGRKPVLQLHGNRRNVRQNRNHNYPKQQLLQMAVRHNTRHPDGNRHQ